MKKTIDSEDEDDDMVIQARNRSRANGTDLGRLRDSNNENVNLMKVQIELGDDQTIG